MRRAAAPCLALACVLGLAGPARGQGPATAPLETDRLASHLLGEWRGSGVYDGNRLELTRRWTLELGSRFLKGDLRVAMPNGASFGALTYWRSTGPDAYEVVWMDGLGRSQTIEALRVPGSDLVASNFLDELAEGGAGWRRWEFDPTGRDAYVERLFAASDTGWELEVEFVFERIP